MHLHFLFVFRKKPQLLPCTLAQIVSLKPGRFGYRGLFLLFFFLLFLQAEVNALFFLFFVSLHSRPSFLFFFKFGAKTEEKKKTKKNVDSSLLYFCISFRSEQKHTEETNNNKINMNSFTYSASLADALRGLLDATPCLQEHVLQHVTALACSHSRPENGAHAETALPLWSLPAGHPPYPHERWSPYHDRASHPGHHQHCRSNNENCPDLPDGAALGPVEMVLTLDIFAVAQASPSAGGALLSTPCTSVDAAAGAAVQMWLHLYALQNRESQANNSVHFFAQDQNDDHAVGRQRLSPASAFFASPSPSLWPPVWWAALEAKRVVCNVRVLLLRIPSIYAVLTTEGVPDSDCLLKPPTVFSSVLKAPGPPSQPRPAVEATQGSENDSLADLSPITLSSAEGGTAPRLSASSFLSTSLLFVSAALAAFPSPSFYPSDGFLEVAPVVHVIGVVLQVYFEKRRAATPAPWVTLLLLEPYSAVPVRRVVDLRRLGTRAVNTVAVLGAVVEVTGHAQVARRPANGRAGGGGGGGYGGGSGEAVLQECIRASWAAAVLRGQAELHSSTSTLVSHGGRLGPVSDVSSSPRGRSSLPSAAFTDVAFQPNAQRAPLRDSAEGERPLRYADFFLRHVPQVVEQGEDSLEVELPSWEEEWAARVALTCWEGARLALGVEASEADDACVASALFSTTLDVILAAQLAVFSAQLSEGVVLCVVDEAPASLLTQMLVALYQVAPAATMEVPTTTLYHARPSLFLPSYRVQHIPAGSHLARRSSIPTTAPVSSEEDSMRPPEARRLFMRSRTSSAHLGPSSAASVAAPPPPFFPEVLTGGVLTQASGRALVLQGLEALPAVTLKVLQEALRTADDDADAADDHSVAGLCGMSADGGSFQSFPDTLRTTPAAETAQSVAASAAATNTAIRDDVSHCHTDGASRQIIQREGGQSVKYHVTHAAVCSVRQGARLAEKSHLFEFAQRCDVVVRPAYDRRRQGAALQAAVDPSFQRLLRGRHAAWSSCLGESLALPTKLKERADGAAWKAGAAAAPTVTEACNRLLSSYFVSAKALCGEATDASMMTTLVKLTVVHAQWRHRLAEGCRRHHAGLAYPTALQRVEVSKDLETAGRATALIDAVVAVGLCDATLHFFTAKTLLGECVFRLLEREAWSIWEAEDGAAQQRPLSGDAAQTVCVNSENSDALRWCLPPSVPREAMTEVQHLSQQLEFRTRLSLSLPPRSNDRSQASVFSIEQLAQDLIDHLERITHNAPFTAESQL